MLVKQSYKNKKVFVGIDVHKKKYVIVTLYEGQIVKKWSMIADSNTLIKQLKTYFKGAKIYSAYEAGFSGFSLHRKLIENKINNQVIHPAHIQVRANDKVKTDKRDAKKIAEQLYTGQLKGIYIPSTQIEEKRSISRGRSQMVKYRVSVGNKIKTFLFYLGIESRSDTGITEKYLKEIESINMESSHKFHLQELIFLYRQITASIKKFELLLKKQCLEDTNQRIYDSVPGIGLVSSRILSSELADMNRFKNERALFSYTGLTPSEYSSGENIRKSRITRQGPSQLRALLIEISWRAIFKDNNLKTIYNRISSKSGSKKAIVAVARRLVGRLRHCLLSNELWLNETAVS